MTAKVCRDCNEPFITKERTIEEVDGELEEVDPRIVSMRFRQSRAQADDIAALTEVGRIRGMNNPAGWAQHVLDAREAKKKRSRLI